MNRGSAVAVLVALVVVAWLAMAAGWRRRAARQVRDLGLPALPSPPSDPGPPLTGDAEGLYAGTTLAGAWLDRVTARGLGTPSAATMRITAAGVTWVRQGAPDVFAAAAAVAGARRADGIAGKVVPPGGIVVVTWRLGGTELDTGFAPASSSDADRLVAAVEGLLPATRGGAA